jgi:hypothetical protein
LGETDRILRLAAQKDVAPEPDSSQKPAADAREPAQRPADWNDAYRLQAAKWGIFVSLLVFAVTLVNGPVDGESGVRERHRVGVVESADARKSENVTVQDHFFVPAAGLRKVRQ